MTERDDKWKCLTSRHPLMVYDREPRRLLEVTHVDCAHGEQLLSKECT